MANKMTREEIIKASKNMDPAELVEKLNEDAANFIEQLPKADKNDTLTLEEWDEQIKTHPLFMTKLPEEGEEMPPLLEALQNLKYDPEENSPDVNDTIQVYKKIKLEKETSSDRERRITKTEAPTLSSVNINTEPSSSVTKSGKRTMLIHAEELWELKKKKYCLKIKLLNAKLEYIKLQHLFSELENTLLALETGYRHKG